MRSGRREGGGGGIEVGEEKKLRVARTYRTVKNALREIFISDISRNHRFTCNRAASHKLSATLNKCTSELYNNVVVPAGRLGFWI